MSAHSEALAGPAITDSPILPAPRIAILIPKAYKRPRSDRRSGLRSPQHERRSPAGRDVRRCNPRWRPRRADARVADQAGPAETTIFMAERRAGYATRGCVQGRRVDAGDVVQLLPAKSSASESTGRTSTFASAAACASGSPAGDNTDLTERIERGPSVDPPVPSYQLDRGRLRELPPEPRQSRRGSTCRRLERSTGVELGDDYHEITFTRDDETMTTRCALDRRCERSRLHAEEEARPLRGERPCDQRGVVQGSAAGSTFEDWADPNDEEFFRPDVRAWPPEAQHEPHLRRGLLGLADPLASGTDLDRQIVADPRFLPGRG